MLPVYKNILDQIPFELIKEYIEEKEIPATQKQLSEDEEITMYLKTHILKYRNPKIQLKKSKQ